MDRRTRFITLGVAALSLATGVVITGQLLVGRDKSPNVEGSMRADNRTSRFIVVLAQPASGEVEVARLRPNQEAVLRLTPECFHGRLVAVDDENRGDIIATKRDLCPGDEWVIRPSDEPNCDLRLQIDQPISRVGIVRARDRLERLPAIESAVFVSPDELWIELEDMYGEDAEEQLQDLPKDALEPGVFDVELSVGVTIDDAESQIGRNRLPIVGTDLCESF